MKFLERFFKYIVFTFKGSFNTQMQFSTIVPLILHFNALTSNLPHTENFIVHTAPCKKVFIHFIWNEKQLNFSGFKGKEKDLQQIILAGLERLKKLYGPFLWMGFSCLKTTQPLRGSYFLPLSSQKFLVLIWSTLEGWKAE